MRIKEKRERKKKKKKASFIGINNELLDQQGFAKAKA